MAVITDLLIIDRPSQFKRQLWPGYIFNSKKRQICDVLPFNSVTAGALRNARNYAGLCLRLVTKFRKCPFNEKSAWRRCKHCVLAVVRRIPKKFAQPQTPFPGAQDGQNLFSWRWSLPSPTDLVWWGSMHEISSYRGNRPTNKRSHTPRQDRLQYTIQYTIQYIYNSAKCNNP